MPRNHPSAEAFMQQQQQQTYYPQHWNTGSEGDFGGDGWATGVVIVSRGSQPHGAALKYEHQGRGHPLRDPWRGSPSSSPSTASGTAPAPSAVAPQHKKRSNGWSQEEEDALEAAVLRQGPDWAHRPDWVEVARHVPGRTGKQCREKWRNDLRPNISKEAWTAREEYVLALAHARVGDRNDGNGNKWREIAQYLPSRPENTVKNHWYATNRAKPRDTVLWLYGDLVEKKASGARSGSAMRLPLPAGTVALDRARQEYARIQAQRPLQLLPLRDFEVSEEELLAIPLMAEQDDDLLGGPLALPPLHPRHGNRAAAYRPGNSHEDEGNVHNGFGDCTGEVAGLRELLMEVAGEGGSMTALMQQQQGGAGAAGVPMAADMGPAGAEGWDREGEEEEMLEFGGAGVPLAPELTQGGDGAGANAGVPPDYYYGCPMETSYPSVAAAAAAAAPWPQPRGPALSAAGGSSAAAGGYSAAGGHSAAAAAAAASAASEPVPGDWWAGRLPPGGACSDPAPMPAGGGGAYPYQYYPSRPGDAVYHPHHPHQQPPHRRAHRRATVGSGAAAAAACRSEPTVQGTDSWHARSGPAVPAGSSFRSARASGARVTDGGAPAAPHPAFSSYSALSSRGGGGLSAGGGGAGGAAGGGTPHSKKRVSSDVLLAPAHKPSPFHVRAFAGFGDAADEEPLPAAVVETEAVAGAGAGTAVAAPCGEGGTAGLPVLLESSQQYAWGTEALALQYNDGRYSSGAGRGSPAFGVPAPASPAAGVAIGSPRASDGVVKQQRHGSTPRRRAMLACAGDDTGLMEQLWGASCSEATEGEDAGSRHPPDEAMLCMPAAAGAVGGAAPPPAWQLPALVSVASDRVFLDLIDMVPSGEEGAGVEAAAGAGGAAADAVAADSPGVAAAQQQQRQPWHSPCGSPRLAFEGRVLMELREDGGCGSPVELAPYAGYQAASDPGCYGHGLQAAAAGPARHGVEAAAAVSAPGLARIVPAPAPACLNPLEPDGILSDGEEEAAAVAMPQLGDGRVLKVEEGLQEGAWAARGPQQQQQQDAHGGWMGAVAAVSQQPQQGLGQQGLMPPAPLQQQTSSGLIRISADAQHEEEAQLMATLQAGGGGLRQVQQARQAQRAQQAQQQGGVRRGGPGPGPGPVAAHAQAIAAHGSARGIGNGGSNGFVARRSRFGFDADGVWQAQQAQPVQAAYGVPAPASAAPAPQMLPAAPAPAPRPSASSAQQQQQQQAVYQVTSGPSNSVPYARVLRNPYF